MALYESVYAEEGKSLTLTIDFLSIKPIENSTSKWALWSHTDEVVLEGCIEIKFKDGESKNRKIPFRARQYSNSGIMDVYFCIRDAVNFRLGVCYDLGNPHVNKEAVMKANEQIADVRF